MQINKGDLVGYSAQFLRNTGQLTGDVPSMTGVVKEIRRGVMADVVWDYGETYPVLCVNLWPVDKRHLEPR